MYTAARLSRTMASSSPRAFHLSSDLKYGAERVQTRAINCRKAPNFAATPGDTPGWPATGVVSVIQSVSLDVFAVHDNWFETPLATWPAGTCRAAELT